MRFLPALLPVDGWAKWKFCPTPMPTPAPSELLSASSSPIRAELSMAPASACMAQLAEVCTPAIAL